VLGLAALTKPEILVATASALAVGMLASQRTPPTGADRALRRWLLLLGTALIPPFAAIGLLWLAMPFGAALRGALGGWVPLATSDVGTFDFYRWVMGIDDPVENLGLMGLAALVWAVVLVPAAIGSFSTANRTWRNRVAFAFAVLVVVAAPFAAGWYDWTEIFRPMVVFLGVWTAIAALRVWRPGANPDAPRAIAELTVSVLALALLAKVFLKPWLDGYAFALLVPGAMLCVFALLHAVPLAIDNRGGDGRLFGRLGLAMLALVSLACLSEAEPTRVAKTVTVGDGADQFLAQEDRRPRMMENLTDWVEHHLPAEATLLVLPEGVMVNYLARRVNPTRHLNFMPPEVAIFGERRMLADFNAHPPDFVALVHRDSSEYKLALFGTDYAPSLLAWVRANYVPVFRVGPEPLRPKWQRRDGRSGWEVRARRSRAGS